MAPALVADFPANYKPSKAPKFRKAVAVCGWQRRHCAVRAAFRGRDLGGSASKCVSPPGHGARTPPRDTAIELRIFKRPSTANTPSPPHKGGEGRGEEGLGSTKNAPLPASQGEGAVRFLATFSLNSMAVPPRGFPTY